MPVEARKGISERVIAVLGLKGTGEHFQMKLQGEALNEKTENEKACRYKF